MVGRPRYQTIISDSARWDALSLRAGDVIVSTPPKAGTTWMQTLCALLVFDGADFGGRLSEISPWLDMLTRPIESVVASLDAQTHRRIIKTHTPLDGLPWDERVTYVVVGRDPRDISVSWDHHADNLNLASLWSARAAAVGLDDLADLGPLPSAAADPVERFWAWAEAEGPSLTGPTLKEILHHLQTGWHRRHESNVALFHYADLKADLPGEMSRLAGALGMDVGPTRLAQLAAEGTFEAMKARADELVPDRANKIWLDNSSFFHKGANGQWLDVVDRDGIARYGARVAELAAADLGTWAHLGWQGLTARGPAVGLRLG
ncbi:MAG TPA: sulfotransferase domain-containing protein [Acidimicrobiales bacterium]|nr:sulfotransferase domain-containing protein [Acidimicrobiales bacterium]